VLGHSHTTNMPKGGGTLFDHFSIIPDPRIDRTKRHELLDIIVIAICAILCGADSWTDIELFGKAKEEWFQTFLSLPNGIPSHDTFGRLFAILDSRAFEKSFSAWVRTIATLTKKEVVAVDGKTARRSFTKKDANGIDALHLVSAFATRNGLVLGEQAVDKKSNEQKIIPALLNTLFLSGCIVTIDAAGCYKNIAETIRNRDADYLIAVKKNQPTLYTDIEKIFEKNTHQFSLSASSEEHAHGRTTIRQCSVVTEENVLRTITARDAWKDLGSVVRVTSERTMNGRTTNETRYYVSSIKTTTAEEILDAVRSHWKIENSLHWILDIAFREDDSRIRTQHAQENFALMRKIALNLLKQETTVKVGIKAKRLKCGWDEPYLLKVLGI
jgi:predicted transposase YbfD/YdcC